MRTQTIKSKWRKLAPLVLGYDRALNRTYSEKVTEEITKFYFQDKDPSSASLTELSEVHYSMFFEFISNNGNNFVPFFSDFFG